MSNYSQSTNSGSAPRVQAWYYSANFLFAILIAVLVAASLFILVKETIAAKEIEKWLASAKMSGSTVGGSAMEQRYNEATSRELTPDWIEVLELVSTPYYGRQIAILSFVSDENAAKNSPFGFSPEPADWRNEPHVLKAYLDDEKPLLDRIKKLSSNDKPVWFPLQFDGAMTLLPHLQEARSVLNLLKLEFDYAAFSGDSARAMEALRAMHASSTAFDAPACMVTRLISIAKRRQVFIAIGESLEMGLWNSDELVQLSEILRQSRDFKGSWSEILDAEFEMRLSPSSERDGLHGFNANELYRKEYGTLAAWALQIPSVRLQIIERMAKLKETEISNATTPLDELSKEKSEAPPKNDLADTIWSLMSPGVEQMRTALFDYETDRRLVLVAVEYMRYRIENGEWPSDPTAILNKGIREDDIRVVNGARFGVAVVADHEGIWLWSLRRSPHNILPISEVETSGIEKTWRSPEVLGKKIVLRAPSAEGR